MSESQSQSQSTLKDVAASTAEKEYIFNRDFRSSMRLNFNHYLMREVAGYLTHPDISLKEGSDIRIADVGTGTGVWACEVASKLGQRAQVDAFDISGAQFPATAFQPANVKFHVHNSFEAYESKFLEQYDVVHVRFMMCSVKDSNVRTLLQQLLSLIKPGGYLQWFEPLPRMTVVRTDGAQPGASTAASERLAQIWHNLDPRGTYSWVENLETILKEANVGDVSRTQHAWPEHLRPLWAQSSLASTADVLPKVDMWNTKEGGLTADFIEGLQLEIAQGIAVDTPFQCIVGRKSL